MKVTEDMLTKKQKECVDFASHRDLIVQGVAGSGKSLVIINRAFHIYNKAKKAGRSVKIAVFTYANSLVDYTKEVLERGGKEAADEIKVDTLDREILSLYRTLIGHKVYGPYGSYKQDLKDVVTELESKYSNSRFFKEEKRDFLMNEINWMKQHLIKTFSDYESCVRKGRGAIRVTKEDRKVIFDVYEKFYEKLKRKHVKTIDMVAEELTKKVIPESDKYDFVLVDEAQDLTLSKMIIAKSLARISISISADFAQKIYKTGFTWKEAGIEIRGQASKKLQGTHRNTKQIAELANSLAEANTEIKRYDDDDYTIPELPEREGPRPLMIYEKSYHQESVDIISLVKRILQEKPKATIALLARDKIYRKKIISWFNVASISYQIIENKAEYKVLEPGVKLVTYHSSKGLEFNYVILPFLDDGVFPYTKYAKDDDAESTEDLLNEARSLLYVGMTRARDMLYMFAVDGVDGNPSPLIDDMDKQLMIIKKD